MASSPNAPPPRPSSMELEQKRRMRLVRAMQRGRSSTLLGSATAFTPGGPQPVQTQTILGG